MFFLYDNYAPFFMLALVYKVMSFFFLFFLFLFTFSSVLLFLQDLAKCLQSGLSINYHEVKGTFFWVCSKELYLKPISSVPQILKIWSITVNLPFHKIWEQSCDHRGVPVGSGRSAELLSLRCP